MSHIGLEWNSKKCAVIHVKREECLNSEGMKLDESSLIASLNDGEEYKFLGVLESLMQEEQLALDIASKSYLQRLAVIWSSPLSDYNKFIASNQYAFPVMGYLMWTFKWPINALKSIDSQVRQIIVDGGGKHPAGSTALLYLSRDKGGRGLRSVEQEYKNIKIKAALKLYNNPDPSIQLVKHFEEWSVELSCQSILKDSVKFATEIGLTLSLDSSVARCYSESGEEIPEEKIKTVIREAFGDKFMDNMKR